LKDFNSIGVTKKGIPIPLRHIRHDFVGQAALAGLPTEALAMVGMNS